MPTFPADRLRRLAQETLETVGTPPESAKIVAESLVAANLAGHDSHGVLRLPLYLRSARAGHVDAPRRPAVVKRQGATAVVDAANGWGQPAMWLATETVIELAVEFGVAAAVVNRSFHIGRVAPYVEAIARAGLIGLAMANAAPAVAPYGGRKRVMGTNPIAWAVPRGGDHEPVSLDVATAAVAEGKLQVARAKGERIAPGLLLDKDGRPTQDPLDFYTGGMLLPFGGHKGSGFSLLAQFVGRGLAGMDPSAFDGPRGTNGPFVLALNIPPFASMERFIEQTEAQCAVVKGSPPVDGVAEVLLPGEPELASRERRLAEGIPVPEPVWDELMAWAAELGVEAS